MRSELRWNPVWIVFLVALVVHLPSIFGGFVYDDHYEILGDGYLRQSNPWLAFRLNLWDLYSIQASAESAYYRPMTRILLWIPYQLVGPEPMLFHLDNVICHAVNCALVAYLTRAYFGSSRVALVSGLLFALHPRHVEPLAWPTAICELFCWTGLLVYLICVDRAAETGRPGWWLLAFLGLLFSGLTKESGLLAGGLAFLGPILNVPQRPLAVRRRQALGALLICVLSAVIYVYLRIQVGQVHTLSTHSEPLQFRMTQGVYIFARLAGLAVWVGGFGLFHGPFDNGNPAHWQWWLSLLLLLAYVLAVGWSWFRQRRLCLGLLWWGYLTVPVTGALVYLPSLLSDRHLYLALVPWAWLGGLLYQRYRQRSLRAVLVLLGCLYCLLTWQQIYVWVDEVRLWRQCKEHCPANTVPRYNLASALLQRGRLAEATAEYNELILYGPDLEDGYLGKAQAQMAGGDDAGAEATLVQALRRGIKPDLSVREALGGVLIKQKRFDAAVQVLSSCLPEAPDRLSLRFLFANALAGGQHFDEARREYETILQRYDRSPGTVHNLRLLDLREAEFHLGHGERGKAEVCLRRLLNQPDLELEMRQQALKLLDQAAR